MRIAEYASQAALPRASDQGGGAGAAGPLPAELPSSPPSARPRPWTVSASRPPTSATVVASTGLTGSVRLPSAPVVARSVLATAVVVASTRSPTGWSGRLRGAGAGAGAGGRGGGSYRQHPWRRTRRLRDARRWIGRGERAPRRRRRGVRGRLWAGRCGSGARRGAARGHGRGARRTPRPRCGHRRRIAQDERLRRRRRRVGGPQPKADDAARGDEGEDEREREHSSGDTDHWQNPGAAKLAHDVDTRGIHRSRNVRT